MKKVKVMLVSAAFLAAFTAGSEAGTMHRRHVARSRHSSSAMHRAMQTGGTMPGAYRY